ncbi:hypothetical protein K7395_24670 [Streptomyces filamentosus]|uniref:DUF5709 domain-containing protein n=2 Tax=Streptomyces filamentosus TaxID=67294 RepID=A0ABY4V1Y8_STRFL|nr:MULTISPECIES: hypothetical protein [Streptomyces]ESU46504.1 hypothetical protein P376_5515 [Streptomyces sp. HCCB10043]MYR78645.1 hypothetical protein [Streptomyces sp. SID5466]USC49683.1 hypothetical protein K7395_24670 [Streptomyces filamentosus]
MSQEERPVEGQPDQEEQAALLRRTDNGPTVDIEEELLRERFGTPDMTGVFATPDATEDERPETDEFHSGQSAAPVRTVEHTDGGESA